MKSWGCREDCEKRVQDSIDTLKGWDGNTEHDFEGGPHWYVGGQQQP